MGGPSDGSACDLAKLKDGGLLFYQNKPAFYQRVALSCTADDLTGLERTAIQQFQQRIGYSGSMVRFHIDLWLLLAVVEAVVIVLLLVFK